jgi:hypothetical protein
MNADRFISPSFSISLAATVLGVLLATVPEPTYAQMRFEIRPVETITLSTQQFLTGDKNGKPAILAGELRIPKPDARPRRRCAQRIPIRLMTDYPSAISCEHGP